MLVESPGAFLRCVAQRTLPHHRPHHIGSSAQIDLTHDNEGDQNTIGDIGATNQPVEILGSTSIATHVAPPNRDAFFDRDSAIVFRELLHNDGALMRELTHEPYCFQFSS